MSNYYLLTRTFLFIIKWLYRRALAPMGSGLEGLVIDIGCGYAPYESLFIKATHYVGVDLASGRCPDVVGDVQALPVATGVADAVFCSEVLEHVVDPDVVMNEISRVLKPGGALLLTVPMSWNLHYEPFDFRRYTSYGLSRLMNAHGYEIVQMKRIGGLFSLVGSRLVDGIAGELFRRLHFIPRRFRHGVILLYTIPVSLLFAGLAWIGDDFQKTDAIGWAVLGRKR